jgi:hypothetical protein
VPATAGFTQGARMRNLKTRVAVALRDDRGMTTAEYAVGTVAACGFGGLLWKILTSDSIMNLLRDIITHALTSLF